MLPKVQNAIYLVKYQIIATNFMSKMELKRISRRYEQLDKFHNKLHIGINITGAAGSKISAASSEIAKNAQSQSRWICFWFERKIWRR